MFHQRKPCCPSQNTQVGWPRCLDQVCAGSLAVGLSNTCATHFLHHTKGNLSPMSSIDKFFYPPTFPLYHYTGVGALEGMASTGKVWASHIYYLNDSLELLHARDVLGEMLEPGIGNPQPDGRAFALAFESWLKSLYSSRPHNIFVFSLSQQQSLLSQWRSYTPHGKGVSIGLTSIQVSTFANINRLRLGKCLYDESSQRALLSSLIQELRARFDPTMSRSTEGYNAHFDEYTSEILQTLALIKHKAFEEEQEWRLISNQLPDASTEICFRQGDGSAMLVPYIKLNLDTNDWKFDSVTLGPTPHETLARSALLGFLHKSKLCRNVHSGNIPYRKW